ncbi:MAG: DUF3800 domain-containing protein [Nitrospirota bacterium]|jgi:hypothetical protein
MLTRPTYRLFLDESGDHSYGKLEKKLFRLLMKGKVLWEQMFPSYPSLEEEGSRYLGLTGTIFKLESYSNAFLPALDALKQDIFNTRDIVFHAKDIIQRRGPFYILQDPELTRAFDERLLDLIRTSDYKSITVVLDKKKHVKKYNDPWHPYQYSLLALMQRYCYFLSERGARGDIVAECRGKRENFALQEAYKKIYYRGDGKYKKADFYQRCLTSNGIKIRKKKMNIHGLQLSDILASPLKKYTLIKYKVIKEANEKLFWKQIIEAAKPKIRCRSSDSRTEGYGIILIR